MSNELSVVPDENKVNDLANRIAEFLPQSRMLPKDTRLTIAQIALAHRLDPFLGDIWAIPERQQVGGEWQTTGYRIMIGITAWRRSAHETNEYWGRRFEKVSDEDRKWLGCGSNDLAIRCIVMRRKTGQQPMEFDGYGIFKAGEKSKMNPLQCVRLRAERDALKGAFPIGFGGGSIRISIADDAGEEINGELPHGPKWDVISSDFLDEEEPTSIVATDESNEQILSEPPQAERLAPIIGGKIRPASVKFGVMTPDQWHNRVAEFCKINPNWQKDGQDDPHHVLISARRAGYTEVTSKNIEDVLSAIVAAHEKRAG